MVEATGDVCLVDRLASLGLQIDGDPGCILRDADAFELVVLRAGAGALASRALLQLFEKLLLLAGRNLSLDGDAALRLLDGVVHFLLLHGSAGLTAVDRAHQALELFGGDCPARESPSQDVI